MAKHSKNKGTGKALEVSELAELGKTLAVLVKTLKDATSDASNDDDDGISDFELSRMSPEELQARLVDKQ